MNVMMKTKTKLRHATFIFLVAFASCGNKFDGLILTDKNTGKKYLLKHNLFDTYMIDEQVIQISGNDTTWVFK